MKVARRVVSALALLAVAMAAPSADAGCARQSTCPAPEPVVVMQPVLQAKVINKRCANCVPVVVKPACPDCYVGNQPMLNGCYACNDTTNMAVGPVMADPTIWRW